MLATSGITTQNCRQTLHLDQTACQDAKFCYAARSCCFGRLKSGSCTLGGCLGLWFQDDWKRYAELFISERRVARSLKTWSNAGTLVLSKSKSHFETRSTSMRVRARMVALRLASDNTAISPK